MADTKRNPENNTSNQTMPPRSYTPGADPADANKPINPAEAKAPTPGRPAQSNTDNGKQMEDLLSQISKSDIDAAQAEAAKDKSKLNIYDTVAKTATQINLAIQAQIKSFPVVFKMIRWIWGVFAGVILIGGLTAAVFLAYVYFSFPFYVKSYLSQHNIVADDLGSTRFSFSGVEIRNARDKNGMYEIKSILLRYTLADLLRKKIKSVSLDGVTIIAKEDKTGFNFGGLPNILLNFTQRNKSHNNIRIASLALNNATLELQSQKFKLPIKFSVVGIYDGIPTMNIPITIKEKYINILGTLSIQGKGGGLEWVVDITGGTLTFPGKTPENITGKMTLTTTNKNLSTIIGEMKLSYGMNSKMYNINLTRGGDGLFAGEFRFNLQEKNSQYERSQAMSSVVSIRFDGLDLKNGIHNFETVKPIQLNIQSFQRGDLMLNSANVRLLGNLICNNFVCEYKLTAPSVVSSGSANFVWNARNIRTDQGVSFTLLPVKSGSIFKYEGGQITLDLIMQKLRLFGYRDSKNNPILVDSNLASFAGSFKMDDVHKRVEVAAEELSYETVDYTIGGGDVRVANVFDTESDLKLTMNSLTLKDTALLKKPARIVWERVNGMTTAQASLENDIINISFEGDVDVVNGNVDGAIYIRPFDVGRIKTPLSDISSLFPAAMMDAKGQLAAMGSIHWKNARQISGPLYVSLKDISFAIGNTSVDKLNGVLALSSLEPLVSIGAQRLFVDKIDAPIPLKNVDMSIQLDPQFFYLTALSGYMGNIQMVADSTLIPYRAPSTTIYLRNSSVDLKEAADSIVFPMSITGRANLTIPVELRANNLFVKNGEIKLLGTKISPTTGTGMRLSDLLTGGRRSYEMRSGILLINSVPFTRQVDIQAILDEKAADAEGIKRSFRKTYRQNLGDLIVPMVSEPVPDDLVKKQQLFSL